MEATGDPTERRTFRDGIRRVFATRATRFPILVLLGASLTLLASYYVQANYINLCERLALFPSRCAAVSLRTAFSVGLGVAGLAMLIIGPIVNSIYHLLRYGQTWESSRVETAVSNYPLLAGVIYLAGAAVLSLT
jgi:hypothetical protein